MVNSALRPAYLKASLLSYGIDFPIDFFEDIRQSFYDNQFVYGRTSAGVTLKHRLPQVLVLGDGVVSAIFRRKGSPWRLRFEKGNLELYSAAERDGPIYSIELPERPRYFDRQLPDGTPAQNVIAVAGEDIPGFFLYPKCHYFVDGTACSFCGMKSTRKTVGKHMLSTFSHRQLQEATRLFQNTEWRRIPLVSLSTGTPMTDVQARKHIIDPIRAISDALTPSIPIHLLVHPPDDWSIIEEYRDAGVTSIAFNIEVFDRDRFGELCPGKAKHYGYDRWIESLDVAREVFGDYKAYCGLVWGLEPPESTLAGHEYFLDRGIGMASNVFHPDPKSVLRDLPAPSSRDILRITDGQAELYARYPEAETIFSVSMRSTLDWEVRRGDFSSRK